MWRQQIGERDAGPVRRSPEDERDDDSTPGDSADLLPARSAADPLV
jgi:hypothetical protein